MTRTEKENYDDYANRFMESKYARGVDSWNKLRRAMESFQGSEITFLEERKLMPIVADKAHIYETKKKREKTGEKYDLYGTIRGITVRIKLTTDKRGRTIARDRYGRFAKRNLR